jgi:metal-dependent amidase/aminoacylase/carboxypeptidase family protein
MSIRTFDQETQRQPGSPASYVRYTVTEHVGGTGIVATLKSRPQEDDNAATELDALPVEEDRAVVRQQGAR